MNHNNNNKNIAVYGCYYLLLLTEYQVIYCGDILAVWCWRKFGWGEFLAVRFPHKINPNPKKKKNFAQGKSGANAILKTYFFLGDGVEVAQMPLVT